MSQNELSISINDEGTLEFIYSDDLIGLFSEGKPTITRASSVEPNEEGKWIAHMATGEKLGPFTTRQEALSEEVKFLKEKMFK